MGLLNKFRKKGEKKSIKEEVTQNLFSLLNGKEQYCAWQKGMGLKTYYQSHSRGDIIEEIIRDITFNISRFEKRIKLKHIEPIQDETKQFKFRLQCELGGTYHSFYIGFNQFEEYVVVEAQS